LLTQSVSIDTWGTAQFDVYTLNGAVKLYSIITPSAINGINHTLFSKDLIVFESVDFANLYVYRLDNTNAALLMIIPSLMSYQFNMQFTSNGDLYWFGYGNTASKDSLGNLRYYKLRVAKYDSETESYSSVITLKEWSFQELGFSHSNGHYNALYYNSKENSLILIPTGWRVASFTQPANAIFSSGMVGLIKYYVSSDAFSYTNEADLYSGGTGPSLNYNQGSCVFNHVSLANRGNFYNSLTNTLVLNSTMSNYNNTSINPDEVILLDATTLSIKWMGKPALFFTMQNEVDNGTIVYLTEVSNSYKVLNYKSVGVFDQTFNKTSESLLPVAQFSSGLGSFDPFSELVSYKVPNGFAIADSAGNHISLQLTNVGGDNHEIIFFNKLGVSYSNRIEPSTLLTTDISNVSAKLLQFKVGKAPKGVTQSFNCAIGSSVYSSTSGLWEYSDDGMATFKPLGKGKGKVTNGIHGADGVLCDETQPNVYVQFTVASMPTGNVLIDFSSEAI
jgi:hypothetical protein